MAELRPNIVERLKSLLQRKQNDVEISKEVSSTTSEIKQLRKEELTDEDWEKVSELLNKVSTLPCTLK